MINQPPHPGWLLFCEAMMHTIIFANGNPPDRATAAPWLASADLIVAADGGTANMLHWIMFDDPTLDMTLAEEKSQ